ncbi:hypothetical protein CP336_19610 [Pseudomonas fluorescens]|nr:hypothetical protein CP336_19610 [Pseudomonas fluorescens]
MEAQTIIVSLTPEVVALLNDNELDLLTELRRQRLDVKRSSWPDALEPFESGAKSVELVILASAAAAPMIASAIARIIDALSRAKKATVTPLTPLANRSTVKNSEPQQSVQTSSHSVKISFLGLKVELTDKYGPKI